MEKIFEIPGIIYDPAESFHVLRKSQAEQDAFHDMQEKQDRAIEEAWREIINAPGFAACEFTEREKQYPLTYILHPSTRGFAWQLTYFAYDGIPNGHSEYTEDEATEKLIHALRECTIHGATVRVLFKEEIA